MRRRHFLLAPGSIALGAGSAALSAHGEGVPGYRISARQLQQALDQRFPLRLGVSGLLELRVASPVLRFLPELDRLGAALSLTAAGPALARPSTGEFDLDFRLRYEAADRSIRAHRLRVLALRVAGLPPPYPELLDGFRQALADQALGEFVLHRLSEQDLALPRIMGLEPDTITVAPDGLVVGFAAQRKS